jgi:hypothetical protein
MSKIGCTYYHGDFHRMLIAAQIPNHFTQLPEKTGVLRSFDNVSKNRSHSYQRQFEQARFEQIRDFLDVSFHARNFLDGLGCNKRLGLSPRGSDHTLRGIYPQYLKQRFHCISKGRMNQLSTTHFSQR